MYTECERWHHSWRLYSPLFLAADHFIRSVVAVFVAVAQKLVDHASDPVLEESVKCDLFSLSVASKSKCLLTLQGNMPFPLHHSRHPSSSDSSSQSGYPSHLCAINYSKRFLANLTHLIVIFHCNLSTTIDFPNDNFLPPPLVCTPILGDPK